MPAPFTVASLPRRSVMGIVNVTPDSFSDGGDFFDADAAIAHGFALAAAGASIIDVGGESTRPGANSVDAIEEIRRVVPVVAGLAARIDIPISVDTTKADVASAALEAGASIVNDVSGGTSDLDMLAAVAAAGAGFVAMHRRGTPRTMQADTDYDDVVRDVGAWLRARVEAAIAAGIDRHAILADPGIGFAKNVAGNVELLRSLPALVQAAGVPLVVGTSRKSFLGALLGGLAADMREEATLATTVWCFEHGAAVVRVHDVAASVRCAALLAVMDRATSAGMAA